MNQDIDSKIPSHVLAEVSKTAHVIFKFGSIKPKSPTNYTRSILSGRLILLRIINNTGISGLIWFLIMLWKISFVSSNQR